MKKALLSLTVVAALIITSCGGKKVESPIVGKWRLAKIDLPSVDLSSNVNTNIDSAGVTGVDTAVKAMTKGMEDMTNAMTGMGEALGNAFLTGSTYEFKDNGKVEVTVLFATQTGDFTVTPDNKTVETTIEGKKETYAITSVSDSEMKLTAASGDVWIFEKK